MTAHRPGRIGLLGAFLLLCACGRSEPGLTETADALRECPQGDAAWRSLLDHPDAADDTGGLRESLAGLGEACPKRWEPAWAMAESLMREDLTSEATPHLEASLRLANEASDPTGIALSKNGLGWSAYVEGRYADAEALYRDALRAAHDAGRIDLASFVHNNLSGVFNDRGLYAVARDHLELAEAGFTELGHEESAIGLAHNRAVILMELGNAVAARQLLEHNHAHAADAGDPWLRDAAAIVLGNLHLALDEPSTAFDWFGRVGEEHDELALRSRVGRGFAELRMEDVATAAVTLEALAVPSRDADRHLGIIVEMSLADALMRQGDRDRAKQILERLQAESGEVGAGDTGWAVRWTLARLHLMEGRSETALPLLREAVALLEEQSSPLDPFGQGLYFLRGRSEPFVDLAHALASRDDPSLYEEIWNVTGQARARALRQSLAQAEDVLYGGVDLSTLRESLRAGETVLSYLIGDDRGVVMAVTKQATRVARIPGRRSFLESLERYLAAIGHPPAEPDPQAEAALEQVLGDGRRLREILIGPVEALVTESSTVYVVPDRELAMLPFSALPSATQSADGVRYLAHDVDVATLPLMAAPPHWSGSWERVFLAGGPTFAPDAGFAELPWAGFELSSLRRLWGDHASRLVNGEAFTREGLRPLATEPFGIVHLATHAVASTRDPRECGVILSGGERLGLDDILDLELDGSLVVLSACRTGQGELVPGEGVIGLGWAFLRAGARGIVISHWSAEDMSSARLMVEFHRRLNEGIDPVRALGAARREMAKETPHPARWALYDIVLRPGSPTR